MLVVRTATRELCQRSFEEDMSGFHLLSVLINSPIEKIPGFRIKDHLEQEINLPDKAPISEIYFAQGYLPNTVSLKIKESYVTAQINGSITTLTRKCLEWESFYLNLEEHFKESYSAMKEVQK
jgi:hypothetical protein